MDIVSVLEIDACRRATARHGNQAADRQELRASAAALGSLLFLPVCYRSIGFNRDA